MKMKTTLSLVAAAAVALLSFGAMAQEKSRAEVKEETKAANKAGQIPSGEQAAPTPKPKSTKARSDVKSETKTANKSGDIATGDMPAKTAKPKSTAARSDVKAETKAANKAGEIQTGEGVANQPKK
jgi:hypothetical protein